MKSEKNQKLKDKVRNSGFTSLEYKTQKNAIIPKQMEMVFEKCLDDGILDYYCTV